VCSAARPGRFTPPGKTRYPLYRWLGGPVWTGGKISPPTGIRSPDRPARSQSLYRPRYPAHTGVVVRLLIRVDTCALSFGVCTCILGVVKIHLRAGKCACGFDGRYLLSSSVLQGLSADLCRVSQQSLCAVSTYCICGTVLCAETLTAAVRFCGN
jgi:hypothetical protein